MTFRAGERIAWGPSFPELQAAMGLLALSERGKPAALEFGVVTDSRRPKKSVVKRVYYINGFRRYEEGHEGPWALLCIITGEGAPEKETKLHYYPHVGRGHVELEVEEDEAGLSPGGTG